MTMIRAFLYPILYIPCYIPQNALSPYIVFFMFLILQSHYFLLKFFYCDNNLYFEFHASVFYVNDLTTKAVLLSSQNNDGLYVLSESFYHVNPLGLLVVAQVRRCNDRPLRYLEIRK